MNITSEQYFKVQTGLVTQVLILEGTNKELEDRISIQQQSLDNLRKENERLNERVLTLAKSRTLKQ